MVNIIETRDLTKRYGDKVAVAELNLTVGAGDRFGFLGPNGSGKTTSIAMLTGTLQPTSGTASVASEPVAQAAASGRIGVVLGDNLLVEPTYTPIRYLRYWGRLFGIPHAAATARAESLLDLLNMNEFGQTPMRKLSGGTRRKVEIARALLPRPTLLFLDEPTRELDLVSKEAIWGALRDASDEENLTLFVSSHEPAEIEALCDEIAIIREGRLSWRGKTRSLADAQGGITNQLIERLGGKRGVGRVTARPTD